MADYQRLQDAAAAFNAAREELLKAYDDAYASVLAETGIAEVEQYLAGAVSPLVHNEVTPARSTRRGSGRPWLRGST